MKKLSEFIDLYHEPIFRFFTGATYEDRINGIIPYECCVFMVSNPSIIMVVSRYNQKDEWFANSGERRVIVELLKGEHSPIHFKKIDNNNKGLYHE